MLSRVSTCIISGPEPTTTGSPDTTHSGSLPATTIPTPPEPDDITIYIIVGVVAGVIVIGVVVAVVIIYNRKNNNMRKQSINGDNSLNLENKVAANQRV